MEKTPGVSLAFLELLSMLELRADRGAEDQVSWQARSWTPQTGLTPGLVSGCVAAVPTNPGLLVSSNAPRSAELGSGSGRTVRHMSSLGDSSPPATQGQGEATNITYIRGVVSGVCRVTHSPAAWARSVCPVSPRAWYSRVQKTKQNNPKQRYFKHCNWFAGFSLCF